MKRILFWVGVAGFFAYATDTAYALPRFAAEMGLKCQSCHINPSGGGMRKMFGAKFGREELPVPEWSKDADLSDFTNLLNNLLGVGADFSTLYFARQIPNASGSGSTAYNSFWEMQGDIYLNFHVAKNVDLYFSKGLYTGFEAFGLLNILPEKGYIKVGKFLPNYGTKLDDHTAYIRTYTGFSPETGRPELTGLESGIAPGPASLTLGLYNATDGFGGSGGSEKALLARAEGMFSLGEQSHFGIGANVFQKKTQTGTAQTLYGAFGSFNIGNLVVLGEGDFLRRTEADTIVTGVILYGEADYEVTQGFSLIVTYDFYDPNKDLKTGAYARYSFGFGFYPLNGVEVRPIYRIVKDEPVDISNNEFDLVFHIYL
jgi:hypothetical protein